MSAAPSTNPVGDGRQRCTWCGTKDDFYIAYHDDEWGVPVFDDRRLFEKLTLDAFQSGLSWITILRKREAFRAAFEGFEMARVAAYGEADIQRLLSNAGIVRHRGKIQATIGNAQAALRIMERPGGFSGFLWDFVGGAPRVNHPAGMADVPAQDDTSRAMAKALKKEGFKFVGPTVAYAFMQAVGMIDDHMADCAWHSENRA